MLVLFCLPYRGRRGGIAALPALIHAIGCMDAQGVLAQNETIQPIQTVCYLSIIFEDRGPDSIILINSIKHSYCFESI